MDTDELQHSPTQRHKDSLLELKAELKSDIHGEAARLHGG